MKGISKSCRQIVVIGLWVCAGSVNADTLSVAIGGEAQSGANYVNFDSLSGGSTASYTSGVLSVSFVGNAQVESSTKNNASASPWLSGNNNVHFESPSTLPSSGEGDTTTYIAAGNNGGGGKATFNFSTAENYFGLVWGSIDGSGPTANNVLTFYSGANGTGTVVDTVTGAELVAADPLLDINPFTSGFQSGYTGLSGTAYVNIGTTLSFESIVATSGNFTFEMDNIAYGSAPAPSPFPDKASGFILLLVGLSSLVLFGEKWNKQQQPIL